MLFRERFIAAFEEPVHMQGEHLNLETQSPEAGIERVVLAFLLYIETELCTRRKRRRLLAEQE